MTPEQEKKTWLASKPSQLSRCPIHYCEMQPGWGSMGAYSYHRNAQDQTCYGHGYKKLGGTNAS